MVRRPNARGLHDADGQRRDWTHLLSAGLLFGSVLGVLIGGAVLSLDSATEGTLSLDRGADRVITLPEPEAAQRPPTVPSSATSGTSLDRLAARAETDLARVSATGGPWTAQLALLCDSDRALGLLDEFGSASNLYVLPTYHDRRACFVFCRNRYTSVDRARQAADLPPALARAFSRPFPKQLADILKGLQ